MPDTLLSREASPIKKKKESPCFHGVHRAARRWQVEQSTGHSATGPLIEMYSGLVCASGLPLLSLKIGGRALYVNPVTTLN